MFQDSRLRRLEAKPQQFCSRVGKPEAFRTEGGGAAGSFPHKATARPLNLVTGLSPHYNAASHNSLRFSFSTTRDAYETTASTPLHHVCLFYGFVPARSRQGYLDERPVKELFPYRQRQRQRDPAGRRPS